MKETQLSETLLDLLVCPVDHQTLAYVPSMNVLYNPRLHKSYEIRNSIPVMLVEESKDVDEKLHEEMTGLATRYTGPRQTHAL